MAAALIRLAADQQLGVAENELGMLYELGEGVPRDRQQAVYWLRKAGSQGDGRAQWIADWLANPINLPHFANEMQLATYIDTQMAASVGCRAAGKQHEQHADVLVSMQDNGVQLRWQATCDR